MPLIRSPQIADPDDFYDSLLRAQRGLSDADAQKLLAKLLLLLANHVGDRAVLDEALALAAARPAPQTAAGAAAAPPPAA